MCDFYIMNKNIVVAEMTAQETPIHQIMITKVHRVDLLPIGLTSGALTLDKWIDRRLILLYRTQIVSLFNSLGLNSTSDILKITKGISLNDTFWIKDVCSRTTWERVSPYTNPLNREIADLSFENSRIINGKHVTHSPEFATSGQFPKCWKRINGKIYLIKGGSRGHVAAGNEPYSEVVADELATKIEIPHVKYNLLKYRNLPATKCANICSEEIGMYPFHDVFPRVTTYEQVINTFKGDNAQTNYILDMLWLDYMSLNSDRHLGNIGMLFNTSTNNIIGIAPIYDNNLAFMPTYLPQVDKDIDSYIKSVGLRTSLGMTFDELLELIKCRHTLDNFKKLANAGCRMHSEGTRNSIVNEIVARQIRKDAK